MEKQLLKKQIEIYNQTYEDEDFNAILDSCLDIAPYLDSMSLDIILRYYALDYDTRNDILYICYSNHNAKRKLSKKL